MDLVGGKESGSGCSRTTISSIRDAFLATAVDMMHGEARREIMKAAAGATASGASRMTCGLLHIQDEASMRLRSTGVDEIAAHGPSRSRSSKVQQHALWLHMSGQRLPLLAELDPLANKSAATIATSLARALRMAASLVSKGIADAAAGDEVLTWFVHVLVGDGVATNEAVAKILFAEACQRPLGVGLEKYFLMLVKCASHQSNLAVGSCVSGRAAFVAAGEAAAAMAAKAGGDGDPSRARQLARKGDGPARAVCGTTVRLFKYLISDYYNAFFASLRALADALPFAFEDERSVEASARWAKLAELYDVAIPPDLLQLLNAGCDQWLHVIPAEGDGRKMFERDPDEYRCQVRDRLLEFLRRTLLVVDEHPTLSRMFTFSQHVQRLLLLSLIGVCDKVFKLGTVSPQERNKKRLTRVKAFLSLPETPQYLRRTGVALRLTDHIDRLCGKLAGDTPMLVRLVKGVARQAVNANVAKLVAKFSCDPQLDSSGAIALVLGTGVEILVRFEHYEL